jgi:Zn-dependent protease
MFRTFRLGRLLGFDIELNLSFLLLLGVVLLMTGGLAGVAIVLVAFASVLLHELGHALVARRLDVRVAGIELHFFGGAAKMIEPPRTPGDEIAIAAAGPAVSFALGGLSLLLAAITGAGLFTLLAWINLLLGGFNLLPALPMDGGRILRAALARRMPFARATRVSVTVARWIAGGILLFAVLQGAFYLALLAVVIWVLGSRELLMAQDGASHYRDQPEVEVLPRDFPTARSEPRGRWPSGWGGGGGRGRGFIIRTHGGRVVVEPLD